MDFEFPEVTNADFLVELKKLLIEVAVDRMYDYEAAEKVDELLIAGSHRCPLMEASAAAEGLTRYSKIKDYIEQQHAEICQEANEWQKQFLPSADIPVDFSDLLEREVRQHDIEYRRRLR